LERALSEAGACASAAATQIINLSRQVRKARADVQKSSRGRTRYFSRDNAVPSSASFSRESFLGDKVASAFFGSPQTVEIRRSRRRRHYATRRILLNTEYRGRSLTIVDARLRYLRTPLRAYFNYHPALQADKHLVEAEDPRARFDARINSGKMRVTLSPHAGSI